VARAAASNRRKPFMLYTSCCSQQSQDGLAKGREASE